MNECIPFYEPGQDITGQVVQAGGVVGKRFLALTGVGKQGVGTVSDDTSGGNFLVSYPAAGGRTFGVSGYDAADGRKVKIVRGPGKIVPVLAGAALAVDDVVQSDATGHAIPIAAGVARGRCVKAAANGTDALIELFV